MLPLITSQYGRDLQTQAPIVLSSQIIALGSGNYAVLRLQDFTVEFMSTVGWTSGSRIILKIEPNEPNLTEIQFIHLSPDPPVGTAPFRLVANTTRAFFGEQSVFFYYDGAANQWVQENAPQNSTTTQEPPGQVITGNGVDVGLDILPIIQTTDTTPTDWTAYFVDPTENGVSKYFIIKVRGFGYDDLGRMIWFELSRGFFRMLAGNVTAVGSTQGFSNNNFPANPTVTLNADVASQSIIVRVVGRPATTITWKGYIERTESFT